MARRDKNAGRLQVRVSHEAGRHSKACVAAAFECLVPILERQVSRQPNKNRHSCSAQTCNIIKKQT